MLLSTLPDLPGTTFEVKGLVCAQGVLLAVGGDNIRQLVESLAEQAGHLSADAVVDVQTIVAGNSGHCVVTGTAVKILESS